MAAHSDLLRQCRDCLRHLAIGRRMPAVEQELRRRVDLVLGPDSRTPEHELLAAALGQREESAARRDQVPREVFGMPVVLAPALRCPLCSGEDYFVLAPTSGAPVGSCSRCGVVRGIAPNGGRDAKGI